MRRLVSVNAFQVVVALSLLATTTLIVGCTTEPRDQALVGFWHVVDINGSDPVPNPAFMQVLLELRPDSTWAQYYNGAMAPDEQGTWTAHTDGNISLNGDSHGEGFVRDGNLRVEWGFLYVYDYRRGRE